MPVGLVRETVQTAGLDIATYLTTPPPLTERFKRLVSDQFRAGGNLNSVVPNRLTTRTPPRVPHNSAGAEPTLPGVLRTNVMFVSQ